MDKLQTVEGTCKVCKGLGLVDTGIGQLECDVCHGSGLSFLEIELELVGYMTSEISDFYPAFLSIEKLHDFDIDVSDMTPVYVLKGTK
jgi:excinuclease UvrABC ATPase subunit